MIQHKSHRTLMLALTALLLASLACSLGSSPTVEPAEQEVLVVTATPGAVDDAAAAEGESGPEGSDEGQSSSSSSSSSSSQDSGSQSSQAGQPTATSPSNQGSQGANHTATSPAPTNPPPPTSTSAPPPTATTSSQVAPTDNDSTFNPAAYVSLAPTGDRRQLVYSDEVSKPQGDLEDWIEFTSVASQNSTNYVWVSLSCSGSANLRAQMYDANSNSEITGSEFWLECGTVDKQITTTSNYDYQFRIYPRNDGYASYTITVKGVR